jgi:hypothetical protein
LRRSAQLGLVCVAGLRSPACCYGWRRISAGHSIAGHRPSHLIGDPPARDIPECNRRHSKSDLLSIAALAAVIGERTPGEAQTMTARRVSGAQPFALFCAARARPARTEAGMTSPV